MPATSLRRPPPKARPDIRGLRSYLLNGLASTTNVCTNGGFETNTTGWITTGPAFYIAAGATFVRDATAAVFGSASGLLTVVATQFQGCSYTFTAEAGQTYTASFYIKGTATGTFRVLLGEADGGTSSNLSPVPSATFTRYQLTWACLADTAAVLNFRTNDAAGACTVNIDGVQIEKGSIATAYVETDGAVAAARPCQRLWLMQEAAGATTAVDATGNADGTATAVIFGQQGLIGRAAAFDGSTSHIDLAVSKEVTTYGSAASVVALVRNNGVSGNIYQEDSNAGGGTGRLTLQAVTNQTRLQSRVSDADTTNTPTGGPKGLRNLWYLAGGSIDIANDLTNLYYNGARTTSTATTNTGTTWEGVAGLSPVGIGWNATLTATFFTGLINFVAVFNRALTDGEHREIARRCGF